MNTIVALIMRRMRTPFVVLILAYAVSILGFVLVPGPEVDGVRRSMDFMHAFYVVSYTATTIGFGEIPYAFSGAQRLWMTATIYVTVIVWFYAIGKILSLIQEPSFRHTVKQRAFAVSVRRFNEPFYIVCGYGDTGSLMVNALVQRGRRAVVIDKDHDRVAALDLEDYPSHVPGLAADASLAGPLTDAGLLNRFCRGVIAVTGSDETNLKIAITVKLLNPRLTVSCRADATETEANMASFGTDQVINAFDVFGDRLALAIHSPVQYLLHEWLTGVCGTALPMPLYPGRGTWLLCGYGRFGKAVYADLVRERLDVVVVEPNELPGRPENCVVGRGTDADTLLAAGIDNAVGIVAGTDDDTMNLSIVMTARMLKPDLFTVARQNRRDHDPIFEAAGLNLVMQRSETIARRILTLLSSRLLTEFLNLGRLQSSVWANELVSRLSAVMEDVVPEVWTLTLDSSEAPAVAQALVAGEAISLGELLRDERRREHMLPAVVLLSARGAAREITPANDYLLQAGDQLLLCTPGRVRERIERTVRDERVLDYLRTGTERPAGWLWSVLANRRKRRAVEG